MIKVGKAKNVQTKIFSTSDFLGDCYEAYLLDISFRTIIPCHWWMVMLLLSSVPLRDLSLYAQPRCTMMAGYTLSLWSRIEEGNFPIQM